jgi:hypothetical protein
MAWSHERIKTTIVPKIIACIEKLSHDNEIHRMLDNMHLWVCSYFRFSEAHNCL